jgi:hypothetical protein
MGEGETLYYTNDGSPFTLTVNVTDANGPLVGFASLSVAIDGNGQCQDQ